jgi:hypothetical protein
MSEARVHTLHGLEPDNLLAFLCLLGALRALAACPNAPETRASWTLDSPPLRPRLYTSDRITAQALLARVDEGARRLAEAYGFEDRADLDFTAAECRAQLSGAAFGATMLDRSRADLLSSLMHDAAVKAGKEDRIDPTPFCLMFGQGHQHFLQRLSEVPRTPAPPPRGKGKVAPSTAAVDCLGRALFEPWRREDATKSFRWDPAEDVRYATMACDPTDPAFKGDTEHGANRLASLGLAALTVVANVRLGRARAVVVGGDRDATGFSFAWPIWRDAITLRSVVALLSHPALRQPGALGHIGVAHVMVARRISVGKFMNFARARPLL